MLQQNMNMVTEVLQLTMQTLSFFDIFSFELFWDDIRDNMKRALQNIYELDKVGQRKLVFCAALYLVFVIIVLKLFSPKKKVLR